MNTKNTASSSGAADLRAAAQALIDRWDTPSWKDAPATSEYISRLRAALAAPAQAAAAREITLLGRHDRDEIGHQELVEAIVRQFATTRPAHGAPQDGFVTAEAYSRLHDHAESLAARILALGDKVVTATPAQAGERIGTAKIINGRVVSYTFEQTDAPDGDYQLCADRAARGAAQVAPSEELAKRLIGDVEVADSIATGTCQRVADLDDRDSPNYWPEAMLVTGAELHMIVREAVIDAQAALVEAAVQPDRTGIYAWVSGSSTAMVLVNKRPSNHAPGGQWNGHVIDSTRFYDGCPITHWGRDGRWTLLHDFGAARAAQGGAA